MAKKKTLSDQIESTGIWATLSSPQARTQILNTTPSSAADRSRARARAQRQRKKAA